MNLPMHLYCVCLPKGNNVCYICFLAFLFSGMAICSFPLFQMLQSHIKIDIHLQLYLDTEIYFSPDVRQQTDS